MGKMKQLLFFIISLLYIQTTWAIELVFIPIKNFVHPDHIHNDGSCMTMNGKDTFIYRAAFRYSRCYETLCCDRFHKIKEVGFNTVETYVPWNRHESVLTLMRLK